MRHLDGRRPGAGAPIPTLTRTTVCPHVSLLRDRVSSRWPGQDNAERYCGQREHDAFGQQLAHDTAAAGAEAARTESSRRRFVARARSR